MTNRRLAHETVLTLAAVIAPSPVGCQSKRSSWAYLCEMAVCGILNDPQWKNLNNQNKLSLQLQMFSIEVDLPTCQKHHACIP